MSLIICIADHQKFNVSHHLCANLSQTVVRASHLVIDHHCHLKIMIETVLKKFILEILVIEIVEQIFQNPGLHPRWIGFWNCI